MATLESLARTWQRCDPTSHARNASADAWEPENTARTSQRHARAELHRMGTSPGLRQRYETAESWPSTDGLQPIIEALCARVCVWNREIRLDNHVNDEGLLGVVVRCVPDLELLRGAIRQPRHAIGARELDFKASNCLGDSDLRDVALHRESVACPLGELRAMANALRPDAMWERFAMHECA